MAFREPLEQRPAARLPHFTCFSSIFISSSYLEIYIGEPHLQGHVVPLFTFELTRTSLRALSKRMQASLRSGADEGGKSLSCSYLADAAAEGRPRPRRCTRPLVTMRRRYNKTLQLPLALYWHFTKLSSLLPCKQPLPQCPPQLPLTWPHLVTFFRSWEKHGRMLCYWFFHQ